MLVGEVEGSEGTQRAGLDRVVSSAESPSSTDAAADLGAGPYNSNTKQVVLLAMRDLSTMPSPSPRQLFRPSSPNSSTQLNRALPRIPAHLSSATSKLPPVAARVVVDGSPAKVAADCAIFGAELELTAAREDEAEGEGEV